MLLEKGGDRFRGGSRSEDWEYAKVGVRCIAVKSEPHLTVHPILDPGLPDINREPGRFPEGFFETFHPAIARLEFFSV